MRVLVAFDKFKDALSAVDACAVARQALAQAHPEWPCEVCPLADGGEGFAEILTKAAGGELFVFPVTGPRGESVNATMGVASWNRIPAAAQQLLQSDVGAPRRGRVAVVEMAAASGLDLLANDRRDAWQTTSWGTGELIKKAAALDVDLIVLGIGGTATNDLGVGALAALGCEFLDASGQQVNPPVPARWRDIDRIAGGTSAIPPIYIASDVANPLLGPNGATAVYGPQKGVSAADVPRLDREMDRMAQRLSAHFKCDPTLQDAPGSGAGGGVVFGLRSALPARLVPGFELVAAWLELESRLANSDLVLTGEGRFDRSSSQGKGPGALVQRALQLGKTVHVFAGQIAVEPRAGLRLHSITPPGMPLAEALRSTPKLLAAAIHREIG